MNPDLDGIDHINVYSKGRTQIGRDLSNFSISPFECPDFGKFRSVEGFWYFLRTGDDRLRDLYGFSAKKLGRELGSNGYPTNFQFYVKRAIRLKVQSNPDIAQSLKESTLPLKHYYVIQSRNDGSKVVKDADKDHPWVVDEIRMIRDELKSGYSLDVSITPSLDSSRPKRENIGDSGSQFSLF